MDELIGSTTPILLLGISIGAVTTGALIVYNWDTISAKAQGAAAATGGSIWAMLPENPLGFIKDWKLMPDSVQEYFKDWTWKWSWGKGKDLPTTDDIDIQIERSTKGEQAAAKLGSPMMTMSRPSHYEYGYEQHSSASKSPQYFLDQVDPFLDSRIENTSDGTATPTPRPKLKGKAVTITPMDQDISEAVTWSASSSNSSTSNPDEVSTSAKSLIGKLKAKYINNDGDISDVEAETGPSLAAGTDLFEINQRLFDTSTTLDRVLSKGMDKGFTELTSQEKDEINDLRIKHTLAKDAAIKFELIRPDCLHYFRPGESASDPCTKCASSSSSGHSNASYSPSNDTATNTMGRVLKKLFGNSK